MSSKTRDETLTRFRELQKKNPVEASLFYKLNQREIDLAIFDEERAADAVVKAASYNRIAEIEKRGFGELANYERLLLNPLKRSAAGVYEQIHAAKIQQQRAAFDGTSDENQTPDDEVA